MSVHKVEILTAARKDLREIAHYIADNNPAAANRIVDEIVTSLKRLGSFPLSAPLVPDPDFSNDGYRVLRCGKYLCFYRLIEKTVLVYHITHCARDYCVLLEHLNFEKDAEE